jgi:integrase/recombinase XerD
VLKGTTVNKEIEDMARDLAGKGYAKTTQKAYLKEAKYLVQWAGKPPSEMTRDELRQYVDELRRTTKSASMLSSKFCALFFLYKKTLGKPERVSFLSLPKQRSKVPDVLTEKEVLSLLQKLEVPRYQGVAMVMYGAGLRIDEALNLQVTDIDGERGVIRVRHGKGDKPREAKLSPVLYGWLREYWTLTQPPSNYLFAAPRTGKRPTKSTINKAFKLAAEAAWIKKPVYAHVLRHSFATHLLEQGVDIYIVSRLLGHESLKSTRRYARVTRKIIRQVPSPVDLLPQGRPPKPTL